MDLQLIGHQLRAEGIGKIISLGSSAISIIFLAQVLDPDDYGLLFLAISIFTIIGVFGQLGFAKSAARYVAEFNEKDRSQIPHIIEIGLKYNLLMLVIVGILLLLSQDIFISVLNEPGLNILLFVGPLYILFAGLAHFFRRIFQGFRHIEYSALVQAIWKAGETIFIIIFVLAGFEAVGALLGYIVGAICAVIVGALLLYRQFYTLYPRSVQRESNLKRRILEYSLPITVTKNAMTIQEQSDILLVGFFLSPIAVAYYTVSKQVLMFASAPASMIGFTISPLYSEEHHANRTKDAAQIYEQTLFYTLLLYFPATAGLILTAEPLIVYIFGAEYSGAIPVLQVFSSFLILQAITSITSDGLDYIGRAKARAKIKLFAAILNVILAIFLIPVWGVIGAALSTLLTYGIYSFFSLYVIYDEFSLQISRLIYQCVPIFGITILVVITVFPLLGFISGIFSLLSVVGVGITIWVAASIFFDIIDIDDILALLGRESK